MTAEAAVHIARGNTGVDVEAARRAAAEFLTALGIDVGREDLRETPARMARAYAELFSAGPLRLTRLEEHGLETFDANWRELSDQLATALRCPCENHPA
jgi:GTP cyclohydrolase IA